MLAANLNPSARRVFRLRRSVDDRLRFVNCGKLRHAVWMADRRRVGNTWAETAYGLLIIRNRKNNGQEHIGIRLERRR